MTAIASSVWKPSTAQYRATCRRGDEHHAKMSTPPPLGCLADVAADEEATRLRDGEQRRHDRRDGDGGGPLARLERLERWRGPRRRFARERA